MEEDAKSKQKESDLPCVLPKGWDRRRLLKALAVAGAGSMALGHGKAEMFLELRPNLGEAPASVHALLAVGNGRPVAMPLDFTGLSYESSQLVHPAFFSAENHALISMFRLLGDGGVLRIGGNMSEYTFWNSTAVSTESPDGVEGPDPGHGTDHTYMITPKSIDDLNAFLKATGWKLIYGLNLARSEPAEAVEEAAYVANKMGDRLLALQFGNEPDLFKHKNDPKDHWNYEEFVTRWRQFYEVVHPRVPHAAIAGPDTSYQPEWMTRFAAEERAKIALLTGHYYAGGPPTDPKMTSEFLLLANPRQQDQVMKAVEIARNQGLPYRMSEGNTCWGGGKKAVSDTFASALWVLRLYMDLAVAGVTGVNLHGGGNGFYTPIAGSPKEGFTARPIYYGMLLAGQLAGAELLESHLNSADGTLIGHVAKKGGETLFLVQNHAAYKARIVLKLPAGTGTSGHGKVWRLLAPELESTSGVTLAGAAVDAAGNWTPKTREVASFHKGTAQLELPAYSAALVRLGKYA